MKACIHRIERQTRWPNIIIKSQRMPAILAELRCYDWISGDVSWVPPFGNRLWAHLENYAPISATHLRFPRNGLCYIVRTPWPKQIRLLARHYLLLRLHRPMYHDTCADVWWWLLVSRDVSRYLGRDTIRVSMYRYGPSGVCSIFWKKALRRCKVQCY